MTVYCDCEECEYYEEAYCDNDSISLDCNGVCECMRLKEKDENESK